MKMSLIWFLTHIVGPITLITLLGGLVAKVSRALNPDGHERAVTSVGGKLWAFGLRGWHFFFLSATEKERLNVHDATGVDPGTVTADTSPDDDAPAVVDIPDTLMAQFISLYGDDPADTTMPLPKAA